MTLSNQTFQQLATALVPEVISEIEKDERFIEVLQELIPFAIEKKLGDIDPDVLYELSFCVMDKMILKGV